MLRSNFIATMVTLLLLFAQAHANQALMKKLVHDYQKNTKSHLPSQGPCTPDKLVVRKEWYAPPPIHAYHLLIMLLIVH
jgi:tyrosinase